MLRKAIVLCSLAVLLTPADARAQARISRNVGVIKDPRIRLLRQFQVVYHSGRRMKCYNRPFTNKAFAIAAMIRRWGGITAVRCERDPVRRIVVKCCVHYWMPYRTRGFNNYHQAMKFRNQLLSLGINATIKRPWGFPRVRIGR